MNVIHAVGLKSHCNNFASDSFNLAKGPDKQRFLSYDAVVGKIELIFARFLLISIVRLAKTCDFAYFHRTTFSYDVPSHKSCDFSKTYEI